MVFYFQSILLLTAYTLAQKYGGSIARRDTLQYQVEIWE
jgi:hypothetical protein